MINCGRRPSSLAGMASAGILSLGFTAAPALEQSQDGAPLLPPNAVIVSWWSYSTPLWHHRWVLGERPDLTIID